MSPGQLFDGIGQSQVALGDRTTQVWPVYQPIVEIADPRIRGTRFQDGSLVGESAARLILKSAESLEPNARGFGGKKVRDRATWHSPELTLLTWRALILLCTTRGAASAHVVDRWANVMEYDDYSCPHCHYEADAAVVYSLDPGEADEKGRGGRLQIIDPRIPTCCPSRPDRPTRGISPDMPAGAMIVFPAEFLHLVSPYEGRRPRITLAWNLSLGPPPDDLPDATQQVAVKVTTGNR